MLALAGAFTRHDLTLPCGRKLTGEGLRFCLACVERLLKFLRLGIGDLLGLEYGILALAHCSEIAGRDLTFASGRKLTGERLRFCLAFVERLLELLLLGIGNLRSEERRVGKEGRSRWWPYH